MSEVFFILEKNPILTPLVVLYIFMNNRGDLSLFLSEILDVRKP